MTDREIEKAFRKMTESEAPDLWEKIEERLSKKTVETKSMESESPETAQRKRELSVLNKGDGGMKKFFGRIGHFLFGGGTMRTAATVFLLCVIVLGSVQAAGGWQGKGWDMAAAEATSTTSNGSEVTASSLKEERGTGTMDGADYGGANSDPGSGMSFANGAGYDEIPAEAEAVEEAGEADNSGSAETAGEADNSGSAETAGEANYNGNAETDGEADNSGSAETDGEADNSGSAETDGEANTADTEENNSRRKLIRNIYMEVETLEFDTLMAALQNQTETLGGYVESSSVNGSSYYYDSSRQASLTLRIPKAKTDEFLEQVGDMANITSRSEDTEDITLAYVDTECHITALRTEQETLLELMDSADTVEDLISIESRLSEVRYELESYVSRLKTYDNQVDYDTVTIWVYEVEETTPAEEPGTWEKMKDGFAQSLMDIGEGIRDMCIWLVAHIPYFIILFVVILAVTAAVKRKRKIRR